MNDKHQRTKWWCGLLLILSLAGPASRTASADPANAKPGETVQPRAAVIAPYVPPKSYVSYRAAVAPRIDGKLDDEAWQRAAWTDDFVDIEGNRKPRPRYRTHAKMTWDDDYFYIAAELFEPHVWGTLDVRDSVIFHDNDFEVFLDPDGDRHNYGEFEINALNTGWDLRLPRPYRDGGPADDGWTITGLKTAVHVNGTLNDPSDTDISWTIEMAVPWSGLAALFDPSSSVRQARRNGSRLLDYAPVEPAPLAADPRSAARAPRDGDQWRVNFSRVEWRHEVVDGRYRRVPNQKEDNWVWSPQHKIDMHAPETWGYVQFSTSSSPVAFRADVAGPAKHLMQQVYFAQSLYRQQRHRYATTLGELNLAPLEAPSLAGPLEIRSTNSGYEVLATVRAGTDQQRWSLRHDSRLYRIEPR